MSVFGSVPVPQVQRSVFNLSHDNKLTLDMGYLVPVMVRDVLPGDRFKVGVNAFVKFMPLLAPVMQRFDLKLEAFFVPNRLIWSNWETFITGGENGDDESHAYPELKINAENFVNHTITNGSLADYLGFPTIDPQDDVNDYFDPTELSDSSINLDALPFRAYQLIYNEYYRDQNLTEEVPIMKDEDGEATSDDSDFDQLLMLRRRAWKKDYFTSCLPFVQRGTDVLLPVGNASTAVNFTPGQMTRLVTVDGTSIPANADSGIGLAKFERGSESGSFGILTGSGVSTLTTGGAGKAVSVDNSASLSVNTRNTTATINDLRTAYAVQRWKERNAVGGARYKEQILSHFNVNVPDGRLQRPEFLGAASSPIIIGEINQTSQSTTSESPTGASVLGGFSGHATGINNGFLFDEKFLEHGWIMVLMSVIPRASYMQGMPRMFSRRDRYDFAWPSFAHLGEQAVLSQELFNKWPEMSSDVRDNDEVFGYQSRFAEYKFIASTFHGAMKDSLKYWHDGRVFTTAPYLNTGFVSCNPSNRFFSVMASDEEGIPTSYRHHLIADVGFEIKAILSLPKYGIPI